MSWVAVGIGGAALVSGYMGSQAAGNAADAQERAANQSNSLNKYIYDLQRQDNQPYMQSGYNALNQLNTQMPELTRNFTMADYQADPGYQFRLDQGNQAIERSAAARGGLASGGTLKALTDYSQGAASQEYQNAYNRFNNNQANTFNRLSAMAGTGQAATQQMGQAGQNYGVQYGQNMSAMGNAQAAGYIGQSNAYTGAINNGTNTWMQSQLLNRMGSGSMTGPAHNYDYAGATANLPQLTMR